jgi:ParB family chromosome partitioning protein
MPKKSEGIKLTSYDDLFSTEETRAESAMEKVQQIPVDQLVPFREHPFKVKDDEDMEKTVESIRQFGVLVPAIARPLEDGGYEIVSGHRRHHAAQLAGLETIPVIVRELDDDAATILMVDSNLQRENILPSERAYAYKMKMDAMKHQGLRTDLTSGQVGPKLNSVETIANEAADSARQVKRYIRLTNLIPALLDMVDEKKIAFNPAVELSYLTQEQQSQLIDAMEYSQATPSLSQAQRLKQMSKEGICNQDVMYAVLSEEKKAEQNKVTFDTKALKKYFPSNYSPQQIQRSIISILEQWAKSKSKDQNIGL